MYITKIRSYNLKFCLKNLLTSLALFITMGLSSIASATIVTTGNLSYDNATGIITDTASGASYLGWNNGAGLTYAETLSATLAGEIFEDYHIANQDEAYAFLNAAIFPVAPAVDLVGDDQADSYLELSTTENGLRFGENAGAYTDEVWFLSNEVGSEAGSIIVYDDFANVLFRDYGYSIADTDEYATGGLYETSPVSWLLVSNVASTSVAEPSVLAVLSLGLLGLLRMKRRKLKPALRHKK